MELPIITRGGHARSNVEEGIFRKQMSMHVPKTGYQHFSFTLNHGGPARWGLPIFSFNAYNVFTSNNHALVRNHSARRRIEETDIADDKVACGLVS